MITPEAGTATQIGAGNDETMRLALVMSGGVSLAVWMGGVTYELLRLRSKDGEWDRIAPSVEIDVIAGTSAGGLNGVLLAAALSTGNPDVRSFSKLREMWLSVGGFDKLLRSLTEANPASILKGDDYFLPELERALEGVFPSSPPETPIGDDELTLLVTTTALTPSPLVFEDRGGESFGDDEHGAIFRFTARDLASSDRRTLIKRLAVAGRCSASFPAAFEPCFVPIDPDPSTSPGSLLSRPNMYNFLLRRSSEGLVPLRSSRYCIDGGVVDNRPFAPAIEAIRLRKAPGRAVRRVVVFVNPDPSSKEEPPADTTEQVPTIRDVLWASAAGIPMKQSLHEQISQLGQLNTDAESRRRLRSLLLDPARANALDPLAKSLMQEFRARRNPSTAARLTDWWSAGTDNKVTDATRRSFESALAAAGNPPTEFKFETGTWSEPWRWGVGGARFVVDAVASALRPAVATWGVDQAPEVSSTSTRKERKRVAELSTVIDAVASLDKEFWIAQALRFVSSNASGSADSNLENHLQKLLKIWPHIDDDAATPAYHAALTVLKDRSKRLLELELENGGDSPVRQLVYEALRRVSVESVLVAPSNSKVSGFEHTEMVSVVASIVTQTTRVEQTGVEQTGAESGNTDISEGHQKLLQSLLAAYVIESAFGASGQTPAEIEWIQISSRAAAPFGLAVEPEQKVTGLKLGHFGAFLKESWRANDWLWGRLDAVTRLCAALPIDDEDVRVELRNALHAEILREELPEVRDAVERSERTGAAVTSGGLAFVQACDKVFARASKSTSTAVSTEPPTPPSQDALKGVLERLKIGDERIEDEAAADSTLALATQALAVTSAALRAGSSGLGPLRHLFQTLRGGTLAVAVAARSALRASRIGAAVLFLVLAVAATVIAIDTASPAAVGDAYVRVAWLVAVIWLVLVLFLARTFGAAATVVVGALLAMAGLYGDEMSRLLRGERRIAPTRWTTWLGGDGGEFAFGLRALQFIAVVGLMALVGRWIATARAKRTLIGAKLFGHLVTGSVLVGALFAGDAIKRAVVALTGNGDANCAGDPSSVECRAADIFEALNNPWLVVVFPVLIVGLELQRKAWLDVRRSALSYELDDVRSAKGWRKREKAAAVMLLLGVVARPWLNGRPAQVVLTLAVGIVLLTVAFTSRQRILGKSLHARPVARVMFIIGATSILALGLIWSSGRLHEHPSVIFERLVVVAILEEILFRGLLLDWAHTLLRKRSNSLLLSAGVACAAFGWWHVRLGLETSVGRNVTVALITAIVLGPPLIAARLLWRSVWPCVALHLACNTVAAQLADPVESRSTPPWNRLVVVLVIVVAVTWRLIPWARIASALRASEKKKSSNPGMT